MQFTDGLLDQFRQQSLEHFVIVGCLEGTGTDQPLATGLLEHIFQFGAAIRRVDVDQNHADLRAGELADAPLGAVGRPDTEPVPSLQTQRHKGPGMHLDSRG